jgi:AmmeMemoRadiSam system protein B
MNVRKRYLPTGWYPQDQADAAAKIKLLEENGPGHKLDVVAAVVPHAGWEFSGAAAASVFCSIKNKPDTVVVIGGHLRPSSGIYAAYEEAYETPFGLIEADTALLEKLKQRITIQEDMVPDNTVEIQLPFIRYHFPEARALWVRAAPSEEAVLLGETLWRLSREYTLNLLIIGSTDLTHYGLNYGFMPKGLGVKAVEWVKQENDKHFIDALLTLESSRALDHALKDRSACSAGGAVTAARYAADAGIKTGRLLSYYTSWDIYPSDSFVGYAGIVYTK